MFIRWGSSLSDTTRDGINFEEKNLLNKFHKCGWRWEGRKRKIEIDVDDGI